MNIGFSIKQIRKEKNISQVMLAKKSGVTQTSISKIESGETMPHEKTIKSICKVLQIPVSFLYVISIEKSDLPKSKQHNEPLLNAAKKILLELCY